MPRRSGMDQLTDDLINEGVLSTPRIIAAFRAVDRALFVTPEYRPQAYRNVPLPTIAGQTISQPLTVAIMLEAVDPQVGDYCLDIGAGSGWAAGVLSALVGPRGKVVAVERIPQLHFFAEANLHAAGARNVEVRRGNAAAGWPEQAPYDVIHVAAAADSIPAALPQQLAEGGRLVVPVGATVQDLAVITKIRENTFVERRIPGFQFVPLIS